MQRLFRMILSTIFAFSMLIVPVYASENTITGFKTYDVNDFALTYSFNNRPSLEELTSNMPDTLDVYVNNQLETVNVTWECVGDDFETSNSYYYQFSPVFEGYTVEDDLDIYRDAPYVPVYLSSGNGISTMSLNSGTTGTNETKIYNYLTKTMGFNTAGACGIIANLVSESGLTPNNLQNTYNTKYSITDAKYTSSVDDGTYRYSSYKNVRDSFAHDSAGYGLVQWTYYSRKYNFYDACKAAGKSIGDINIQLEFMSSELAGYSSPTASVKLQPYIKSVPNTATGSYNAAYAYCYYYERPSDKENRSVTRGNLAKKYYAYYKSDLVDSTEEVETLEALDTPTPTLTITENHVDVSWNAVNGATGYYVYRKLSTDSSYTKVKTTTTTSYSDTSVSFNKKYYYYIVAYNDNTKSDHTSKNITYLPKLTATLSNTSSGVKLTWSKVTGATGYYIYCKIGSGSYKKIKTITSNSTVTFTNKSLTSGTKYTYYVKAYKSTTYGTYTAKSIYWLSKVTGLKSGTSTKKGCNSVSWTKTKGATGYEVWYQRSTVSGSSGTTCKVTTNKKNFTEMAVKAYRVKVRAYKTVGSTTYYGPYSAEITMKVKQ